jgi:hypothetical protein
VELDWVVAWLIIHPEDKAMLVFDIAGGDLLSSRQGAPPLGYSYSDVNNFSKGPAQGKNTNKDSSL